MYNRDYSGVIWNIKRRVKKYIFFFFSVKGAFFIKQITLFSKILHSGAGPCGSNTHNIIELLFYFLFIHASLISVKDYFAVILNYNKRQKRESHLWLKLKCTWQK